MSDLKIPPDSPDYRLQDSIINGAVNNLISDQTDDWLDDALVALCSLCVEMDFDAAEQGRRVIKAKFAEQEKRHQAEVIRGRIEELHALSAESPYRYEDESEVTVGTRIHQLYSQLKGLQAELAELKKPNNAKE